MLRPVLPVHLVLLEPMRLQPAQLLLIEPVHPVWLAQVIVQLPMLLPVQPVLSVPLVRGEVAHVQQPRTQCVPLV